LKDLSTGEEISAWIWDYDNHPVTSYYEEQSVSGAIYNSTGIYPVTLIVSNRFGCADTLTREIHIHANPVADFTFENPCQQTDILFTDQSLQADTSLILYSWNVNTGARSQASMYGNPVHLNFEEARAYEVTHEVTDGFGCRNINKKTIHVRPKPKSNFSVIEDANGVNGLLEFMNRSEGANLFYWDFGNGETSELPEPQIKYNEDGRFNISLVVINAEGCSDTSDVSYFYTPGVWLPTVFSPDFNGKNDQFKAVTQNHSLSPFQMLIFDKWGQLVFESSNPEIGWDGTNKGRMCNTGEYVYVLRYTEQTDEGDHLVIKKGMVLLLR
jgi:gliding motility-associated-like protein